MLAYPDHIVTSTAAEEWRGVAGEARRENFSLKLEHHGGDSSCW